MILRPVLISTDSTADMSPEMLSHYQVRRFPLYVVMDDQVYEDGVTVTSADVFDYFYKTGKLARTAAPNLHDFVSYFTPLSEQGYDIVHFDISGQLSSTYNVCQMAAADFDCVYSIDSRHLSSGIALLVIKACELRDQGLPAKEIVSRINDMRDQVETSFVIDTLRFLHKGGRCSALAAMGANLLKLKPCIEMTDAMLQVGKKYRGRIEDVFMSYIADKLQNPETLDLSRAFITHTITDEALVERCADKVRSLVNFKELHIAKAGPTISVHCGPDTMGVLFMRNQ